MEYVFLYITADSPEPAVTIGRGLVEERLAACVNILGAIQSFYWWEGAVQEGKEAALIAKTRADMVDAVTKRIKATHAYSCPCVVSLPVSGGNPDFLDWIGEETAAPANGANKGNA